MPLLVLLDNDINIGVGSLLQLSTNFYIPGFYRDNPTYDRIIELIKVVLSKFDDIRNDVIGMQSLIDPEEVRQDFLNKLATLVGYAINTTSSSVEEERFKLITWLETLKLRGTTGSIDALLHEAGATILNIFYNYNNIFEQSTAQGILSGINYIEDDELWRFGTYEIITNSSQNKWINNIPTVNPAGKRYIPNVLGATVWEANKSYSQGAEVISPTEGPAGFLFIAQIDGTSGNSEPTWASTGQFTFDGTQVWLDLGYIPDFPNGNRIANTGTVVGGVTFNQPSLILDPATSSTSFNGTNSFIKVYESNRLTTNVFTFVFWMKSSTFSTSDRVIAFTGEGSGTPGWELLGDNNISPMGMQFQLYNTAGNEIESTFLWAPFTGGSSFIAFAIDGINDFIYTSVNGQPWFAQSIIPGTFTPETTNLIFGGGNGTFFNGNLQEIAFFNYILDSDTINGMYNAGFVTVPNSYGTFILGFNPISFWPLHSDAIDMGTGL